MLPFLNGCVGDPDAISPEEKERLAQGIYRFHDKELGVTCYLYYQNSIDCVPDHQLMPVEEAKEEYPLR